MASAFARRDFDEEGVVPDVELTLQSSSWLGGTYRGYEEFSWYVEAARLVLEPAGRALTYLHHEQEMVIVHEFEVGGRGGGPEIPLHVSVRYAPDERIRSLLIQPKDQTLFDRAVDAFLSPRTRFEESA